MSSTENKPRKMQMVAHRHTMEGYNQGEEDLDYWLSRPPLERIAAVTFLVKQSLMPGQRMDKTKFKKSVVRK